MPFGLTTVFQQGVLAGLNPDAGPDFVAVYIDDVLIFSCSGGSLHSPASSYPEDPRSRTKTEA